MRSFKKSLDYLVKPKKTIRDANPLWSQSWRPKKYTYEKSICKKFSNKHSFVDFVNFLTTFKRFIRMILI
jgi:hypothetical protein